MTTETTILILSSLLYFIGILLLFSGIYFFILPEKMVVGGSESILILLDKIFCFHNGKQNYFFIRHNFVIFIRFICLILGYILLGPDFFKKTLFITICFFVFFNLFDYQKIDNKFFIRKIWTLCNDNIFFSYVISVVCIILTIGIGSGLIFNQGASSGGIEFLYLYLHETYKLNLFRVLFFSDGLVILFSFFIDFARGLKEKKKIILIRYVLSFTCFILAILLIDIIKSSSFKKC